MRFPALTQFAALLASSWIGVGSLSSATPDPHAALRDLVQRRIDAEYPSLFNIYTNLHAHPELSFMEVKTAALVAGELRALGFSVTEKVGNTGVVGVFTNGPGPTVLVRADMDGLPIQENSGVPYASTDMVRDLAGNDQPAMHGCAHDTHVTSLIGTARVLVTLKDKWAGTLVFVAQPAEEIVAGARAMLRDGLYTRFPKPDFALALHTVSGLPAGSIGYGEGPFYASINSVDIVVRGVGGHGSRPHTTKDPIVLASQIVLALQTIVSRELKPGAVAVVTVGTIHGGLKRNIIPDDVKLELTLRAFDDQVMDHLLAAIHRMCAGLAHAAGLPDDRQPIVTVTPESVPVTINDSTLTRRLAGAFTTWFGPDRVKPEQPTTGGEDFSEFGRTPHRIPISMWWVGATDPAEIAEAERTGIPVPSNHSATFAPVPEPTLKTCVTSMTAAVLELMAPSLYGQATFFRDHGGVADAAGPLPVAFDDNASRCWRQPLLPGHSSPIVHGSSIYLTTYDANQQQLATVALDLETGVERWRRIAPVQRLESTHRTGGPAVATPACDGQRLFIFFGSYGLLCYGLDGTELWKLPMGPFQDEYGAGSSPILVDGRVIISQDHDIDSFVMAVDAQTGRILWKTARPDAVRSYATPAVWTHQGEPQILVPGALRLTSYDARDGSPLWWIDGLARIVIPAPAVVDDSIYVASWAPGGDTGSRISLPPWTKAVANWDKNSNGQLHETEITDNEVLDRFFRMDLNQNQALDETEWARHAAVFQNARNGVLAIRPEGRGDLTGEVQWTYSRGAPYVASPLVHHGILWMVKDGGLVTKLDAVTGQLLHQERLPGVGSYYASPVCADGKVYFASEPGVVSVVADQRDWRILSSHDFEERIYATPAVIDNRILIRTEAALYGFRGRRSSP